MIRPGRGPGPVYPGIPRRLIERWTKKQKAAREAYDADPQSTHRQPGAERFLETSEPRVNNS